MLAARGCFKAEFRGSVLHGGQTGLSWGSTGMLPHILADGQPVALLRLKDIKHSFLGMVVQ